MIRPLPAEVRSHLRSGVAVTSVTQCVEELLLNSLDAGATCVAIRLDLSNFRIQVVDNGAGVSHEQLELLATRYATSKCHTVSDLENLSYFGFRGEALASIRDSCAVMQIVTREKTSSATYCRIFQNGKPLPVSESTAPRPSEGMTITVHGLFQNFPVRQKSTNESLELEKTKQRVEGLSLLKTDVSVSLRNDVTGNVILQTHKSANTLSTFAHLFGHSRASTLVEVRGSEGHFTVDGYLGKEAHTKKSLQFIYINGRLVLKTQLHKAVNKGMLKSVVFRKKVAQFRSPDMSTKYAFSSSPTKFADRYPVFVLNVKCPLTEYDITFDPSKTLVEFKDWDTLLQCTSDMVDDFLKREKLDVLPGENCNDNSKLLTNNNEKEVDGNLNHNIASAISPSTMKDTLFSKTAKKAPQPDLYKTPPQLIPVEEWRDMHCNQESPVDNSTIIQDDSVYAFEDMSKETADRSSDEGKVVTIQPTVSASTCTVGATNGRVNVASVKDSTAEVATNKSMPSFTSSLSRYKLYVCDSNNKGEGSKLSEIDCYKTPVSIPLEEWKMTNQEDRGRRQLDCHNANYHHGLHKHSHLSDNGRKVKDCKKVVGVIPVGRSSIQKAGIETSAEIGSSLSYYKKCIGNTKSADASANNGRNQTDYHVLDSLQKFRSKFGLSVGVSRKATETKNSSDSKQAANNPSEDPNKLTATPCAKSREEHFPWLAHQPVYQKSTANASWLLNSRKRSNEDLAVQLSTASKLAKLVQQNVAAVSVGPVETESEMHNHHVSIVETRHHSPDDLPEHTSVYCGTGQNSGTLENQLDNIEKDIDNLSEYILNQDSFSRAKADSNSEQNETCEEGGISNAFDDYLVEDCREVRDNLKRMADIPLQLENTSNAQKQTVEQLQTPVHESDSHMRNIILQDEIINRNNASIDLKRDLPIPTEFQHSTMQAKVANDDCEMVTLETEELVPVSQGFTPMLAGSQSGLSDRINAVNLSQNVVTPNGRCLEDLPVEDSEMYPFSNSQESRGFSPTAVTPELHSCSPSRSSQSMKFGGINGKTDDTKEDLLSDVISDSLSCNQLQDKDTEVKICDGDGANDGHGLIMKSQNLSDVLNSHCASELEDMVTVENGETLTSGELKLSSQVKNDEANVKSSLISASETSCSCKDLAVTQESVTISQLLMSPSMKTPVSNYATLPVRTCVLEQPVSCLEYSQAKENLFADIFSQPLTDSTENYKIDTCDDKAVQAYTVEANENTTKAARSFDHNEIQQRMDVPDRIGSGEGATESGELSQTKFNNNVEMFDISFGSSFSESITEVVNHECATDRTSKVNNELELKDIGGGDTGNTRTIKLRGVQLLKSEGADEVYNTLKPDAESEVPKLRRTDSSLAEKSAMGTNSSSEEAGNTVLDPAVDVDTPVNPWILTTDPSTGEDIYVHCHAGTVLTKDEYTSRCQNGQGNARENSNGAKQTVDAIITRSTKILRDCQKFDHIPGRVRLERRDSSEVDITPSEVDGTGDGEEEEEEEDDHVKWRDRSHHTPDSDVDSIFAAFHAEKGCTRTDSGEMSSRQTVGVLGTAHACKFTKQMLETVKVIGQLDNKFIACLIKTGQTHSGEDMLTVVDQHAAHERIRLEMLTEEAYVDYNIEGGKLQQYDLDHPKPLTFTEEEVRVMSAYTAEFTRIGIGFTQDTGDRTRVFLHAIPACLVVPEVSEMRRKKEKIYWNTIQTLIKEHVEVLLSTRGAGTRLPAVIHKLLCSFACHGAIKFGDPLTLSECEALIRDLSRCDLPFQCAHGRPSVMPVLELQQLHSKLPQEVKSKPKLYKLRPEKVNTDDDN